MYEALNDYCLLLFVVYVVVSVVGGCCVLVIIVCILHCFLLSLLVMQILARSENKEKNRKDTTVIDNLAFLLIR